MKKKASNASDLFDFIGSSYIGLDIFKHMLRNKPSFDIITDPNKYWGNIILKPTPKTEEFRNFFKEHNNPSATDFLEMYTKDNVKLPGLYRLGGIPSFYKDYAMFLKYETEYYDINLHKEMTEAGRKHLAGYFCIFDKDGNVIFKPDSSYDHPSLIKNSCLFIYKKVLYNTIGEKYGEMTNNSIETDINYIVELYPEKDKYCGKNRTIIINKQTGEYNEIE